MFTVDEGDTYAVAEVHEIDCSSFVRVVAFGRAGNVDVTPVDGLKEQPKVMGTHYVVCETSTRSVRTVLLSFLNSAIPFSFHSHSILVLEFCPINFNFNPRLL